MEVVLYTTHCPKCKVLEKKLRDAHLFFKTVDDEQAMIEKGFMEAPKLEVDGEIKGFAEAIDWLKTIKE